MSLKYSVIEDKKMKMLNLNATSWFNLLLICQAKTELLMKFKYNSIKLFSNYVFILELKQLKFEV